MILGHIETSYKWYVHDKYVNTIFSIIIKTGLLFQLSKYHCIAI